MRFQLIIASVLVVLFSLPAIGQAPAPEVYTVDRAHSLLDFTVRLAGFNRVRGSFGDWRADFSLDPSRPLAGRVSFSAEVASISTQIAERDEHLRGPDFFDATRVPQLRFEGQVVSAVGGNLEIAGLLTIRDSTRAIRFPATIVTPDTIDPFGNRRISIVATLELNRRDFGINGPRFWSTAISQKVEIDMEIAGRIWGYDRMGYGRRTAVHGPAIVAASDSGVLAAREGVLRSRIAEERDTLKQVRPFEMGVAVGRLIQAGKLEDAAMAVALFGMGIRNWPAPWRSEWEARRGEVLVRRGQLEQARQALDAAITLDPSNTNARAWRLLANGT